jgi:actin cytoskeleton-regulatory complex protein PAN1
MYSNSNSFLGGNNTLRSQQQQQYGAPFGQQPPPHPGGQPGGFAPQPTGYGQAPLTQQYTGFPGVQGMPQQQQPAQGLQPQYTGFPGQMPPQQQQSFQTGAPPVPQIPQQFQQQYNQQQPQSSLLSPGNALPSTSAAPASTATTSAPSIKPQPTGFSAMAASFRTGGKAETQSTPQPRKTNKIPNIRLSFITAQDQSKFETLFKSAVGDSQTTMSGEKARDLLLRSRLDGDALSHIWYVMQD